MQPVQTVYLSQVCEQKNRQEITIPGAPIKKLFGVKVAWNLFERSHEVSDAASAWQPQAILQA